MFNKDKSNNMSSISGINYHNLVKFGSTIVATLMLANSNAFADVNLPMDIRSFHEPQLQYEVRVQKLRESGNFDQDLMNVYNFYAFKCNDELFNSSRVYLAYGYDESENLVMYIVVPALGNYDIVNQKEYKLHNVGLVQLRQTSLFIDLLSKDLIVIDENNMFFELSNEKDKINECIKNWDGLLHDLVPETASFNNKVIIKK